MEQNRVKSHTLPDRFAQVIRCQKHFPPARPLALRTIDEMTARVKDWSAELAASGSKSIEIGLAVTTASVVFGAVGDETRLEYTVIGDAVNFSAKLEKHNKAEGVRALAARDAHELALHQGYAANRSHPVLERRAIEGVADPMDLVVMAG